MLIIREIRQCKGDVKNNIPDTQHVEVTIDGVDWRIGNVPAGLSGAELMTYLEGNEELMRGDMRNAGLIN